MEKLLTKQQVAELTQHSVRRVQRWITEGKIKSVKRTRNGLLFDKKDVEQLLKDEELSLSIQNQVPLGDRMFLTLAEASEYIGVSPRTFERYRKTGAFVTYTELASEWRFRREEITHFFEHLEIPE